MILTERDQALLLDLHQYGIHTTRGLASRHFPGVAITTVLRRLRALEEHVYVQRISGLEGGANAWALTKKSAERFATASKVHFPRIALDHDLRLTALRLRLEGASLARSWRPEHEIRARVARRHGLEGTRDRVIPDGLMGIETSGRKETVAIELELFPKNQARYRRIFQDYASKENLWGVWYVVENPTIGRQLMKAARDTRYVRNGPFFFWTVREDVMRDPLGATLQGMKERFRLGELWVPKAASPAHTPAQGMSTTDVSDPAETSLLSTEEKTENRTIA